MHWFLQSSSAVRHPRQTVLLWIALSGWFVWCGAQAVVAENRSYTGQDNNLSNPSWGSAGVRFRRQFGTTHYTDGMASPAGAERPNPRDISNRLGVQPVSMPDPRGLSDFTWQWGQFLDHDIALRRGGTEPMPIMVPSYEDPLNPLIPFARSAFDSATGHSPLAPREQLTDATAYIDASMIYGADPARAAALRTMQAGRLATSHDGALLPYNTSGWANDNEGDEPAEQLFLAGDPRANEHVGLTSMHTLFVREHNRLVGELSIENPTWNDEQLYQHARKIVGALVQSITYNEYLPALLGPVAPDPTMAAYDPHVDASLTNEFATAAFRLGHTQVSPLLQRMQSDGQAAAGGPLPLKDAFFIPSYFDSADDVDQLLMGLASQTQQRTDIHMPDALRNSMFGVPGQGGMDLFAINVQRGRDHGLPTYNEVLAMIPELEPAERWSDISSNPQVQTALAQVYNSVDDVDLWVGLLAQDAAPDAAVGSTLQYLVAEQFAALMHGDRFFYLWDESLSVHDRTWISQTRLSDIILRNTSLNHLQANVFFVPEPATGLPAALGIVAWWGRRRRRKGC